MCMYILYVYRCVAVGVAVDMCVFILYIHRGTAVYQLPCIWNMAFVGL